MPRARIEGEGGGRHEWRSQIIPRYQRRTERVDEAILGVYLSGTNTRRLRGALAPLLRGTPLSKDAVSRLVGRLKEDFTAWAKRDLGALKVRYLFLDGWYPRVRIGKKRVRVPVLVTLAVRADGHREIVDLRLAGVESERAWLEVVHGLVERKLGAPVLAVIDGNPGLAAALSAQWPKLAIQRCTNHKLWNLLAKALAHLREELAEDYRRMIYAESREAVEQARRAFARNGSCAARRYIRVSKRPATSCLPLLPFRPHNGRRCAPPTRWSASTRSSAGGPRPRPRCRTRRRFCCCCSDCCAAARSNCAGWSVSRNSSHIANLRRLRSRLIVKSLNRQDASIAFPPDWRHYQYS